MPPTTDDDPPPWASEEDPRTEWVPSQRRVRVIFNNETVADSDQVMLLRQHGFLPVYYFPERHVRQSCFAPSSHTTFSPYKGTASYFHVRVGDRVAESAAWTYRAPLPGSPNTRGYYSFHWHAMDAWFEEDEEVLVHARDPYLRVETLHTSQSIEVRINGLLVAQSSRPVLLLETGLIPRYYVPLADLRMELFQESGSYSMCPYKGFARYLNLRAGGTKIDDAAWYYPEPLPDVMRIANHASFWSERPEASVVVEGVELARLGIRSSSDGGELLYPARRFFIVPPPRSMRGALPGQLQHDYARPNGRAEGPPDHLIDMAIERAGGTLPRPLRSNSGSRSGLAASADEQRAERYFLFGPARRAQAINIGVLQAGPEFPASNADIWYEEPCRQVRALFGGVTVASSRRSLLVHLVDRPPVYYFPIEDVRHELLVPSRDRLDWTRLGPTASWHLEWQGRRAERAAWSHEDLPPAYAKLRGRVAFEWDVMDAWFEEDDEIRGHPRSAYHRVDALHSCRSVRVTLEGHLLAETHQPVTVFETGLPTRFFIPKPEVAFGVLVESGRKIECPYKGSASLFSARIDGSLHPDVAWSFRDPLPECPKIADLICFDEAQVQIETSC